MSLQDITARNISPQRVQGNNLDTLCQLTREFRLLISHPEPQRMDSLLLSSPAIEEGHVEKAEPLFA